jgi:hypothetical protein
LENFLRACQKLLQQSLNAAAQKSWLPDLMDYRWMQIHYRSGKNFRIEIDAQDKAALFTYTQEYLLAA